MRCPPLLALMLCLTLSPAAIAVETDEAGPPPAAESAPGADTFEQGRETLSTEPQQ